MESSFKASFWLKAQQTPTSVTTFLENEFESQGASWSEDDGYQFKEVITVHVCPLPCSGVQS